MLTVFHRVSLCGLICLIGGSLAADEPTAKPVSPKSRAADPLSIDEETYLFTPAGFKKPGEAKTASGENTGTLKIIVIDAETKQPTFCRINVVGPDGNYYQPAQNYLTPFALTGEWPKTGKGNRQGKAPFRYYGRFFYSWGKAEVQVPPGPVRVEVWKGLEYRPLTQRVTVDANKTADVALTLERTLKMPEAGYYSGDPHVHITRADDRDENLILDLMEAECIRYASILAYNEPAGPYNGMMKTLDMPQYRGLGKKSIRERGEFSIMSGQEYRSRTFGHLNLFLRDNLVLEDQKLDLDDGPPYGSIGRDTQDAGGFAIYAHGGYAQSIYADLVQGDVNAVELLQFGIYRGMGIDDWYRVLNIGYRFPIVGACDYPACRKLGDAMTYVYVGRDEREGARGRAGEGEKTGRGDAGTRGRGEHVGWVKPTMSVVTQSLVGFTHPTQQAPIASPPPSPRGRVGVGGLNGASGNITSAEEPAGLHRPLADKSAIKPTFPQWLEGAAAGRSFVTTGPMLLLEVDGHRPGDTIEQKGAGPFSLNLRVRVSSVVAPVTHLQVVVNGRVVKEQPIPAKLAQGGEFDFKQRLDLSGPAWIAARAFSKSPAGNADAESHTNPVYFYVDGKKPYDRASLDEIVKRIDDQIEVQKQRKFAHKAEVLARYDHSRDILMKIREADGIPPGKQPTDLARDELPVLKDPGARTHTEAELKEFLKPIPPKTPAEALKTFETEPGFEMQLVAHEPDVVDPIAACFDEDGKMYVCEMRDYPYFPKPGNKPLGTVRLLRDTDGDGVFDDSHVFADELLWAGGVVPWKGGVYVAAPPDIWYMKDTDGDFKADIRRKVFTGFGTQNQQAMLNNLTFGLDHKIYGATAGNGGEITPIDARPEYSESFDGKDFRFDPNTEDIEPISGTVQFGNTFDDWGNRFVCSQGNPLEHVVLPLEYLKRNPFLPVPKTIHDVAGDRVPIFRISPVERWRLIRSSRRIAHGERDAGATGASQHVVDAAAGVTIYRGGAYPKEYYGNAFVGDAQNNLIHRRILTPNGVTFDSHRAPETSEFVRSSDNWFRPVNFINAPDGTLYALDMNREILESIHIPLDVLKFLDLKSGRNTGRIYRIAPKGFKSPPPPHLSTATNEELVEALKSPHGWWRDTAHRLIYERHDEQMVLPLSELLQHADPRTRVHALWSLMSLVGQNSRELIQVALRDSSPYVREQGVIASPANYSLVDDDSARVRMQSAFKLVGPGASDALASIARRDADDPWIRTAVLSSAQSHSYELFRRLLADKGFIDKSGGASMLEQLATVVGIQHQVKEVDGVLQTLATNASTQAKPELQQRLALALGEGLQRSASRHIGRHFVASEITSPEAKQLLQSLFLASQKVSADDAAETAQRVRATQLLSKFEFALVKENLAGLMQATQPLDVQLAGLNALAGYTHDEIADMLLAHWDHAVPELRQQIVRSLLSRESWTVVLLLAARDSKVSPADIDSLQRTSLREHRNPAIRTLAERLFGSESASPRSEVVASYKKSAEMSGDAKRGLKVFEQNCMVCHRIGEKGFSIGPDLTSTASADREALLAHILDPNRYVLPNFVQYIIVDVNGQSHTGIIASQTATSVTLKQERDATETILRSSIDQLKATGKSLMPEGFEKKIPPVDMSDLLSYLEASRLAAPTHGPRLDIGTEPGLVEPN